MIYLKTRHWTQQNFTLTASVFCVFPFFLAHAYYTYLLMCFPCLLENLPEKMPFCVPSRWTCEECLYDSYWQGPQGVAPAYFSCTFCTICMQNCVYLLPCFLIIINKLKTLRSKKWQNIFWEYYLIFCFVIL
jgi:hypothetical protein